MSYRNKTYVAFDGTNDMQYYRTMQMWKANHNIEFDFFDAHDLNSARDTSTEESIKAQLRTRMINSKQMILLVGDNTKYLKKFVSWEIELARKKDIPIIVVNLNGDRVYNKFLCPASIKDETYTINISFNKDIIKYALDNFPDAYSKHKYEKNHTFFYKNIVYNNLGL